MVTVFRRSCDLTFRALPGGPHVLQADVEVDTVEAAVFGFGVMVLQVLPKKLSSGCH